MRISRIVVTGLADRFNHDLTLDREERVSIIISPNGFGKTLTLKIINGLFNRHPAALARMPFRRVDVYFDDSSVLTVNREAAVAAGQTRKVELILSNQSGTVERMTPKKIDPKELQFPVGMIEEFIPALDQIGAAQWRNRQTGEMLGLEDVLERYGDEFPEIETDAVQGIPEWLQRIRKLIPVRFIDTERLTRPLVGRVRAARFSHAALNSERTVRRYSEDLAARVQKTLTEYGALAQSLDRTFPVRLVEGHLPPDQTMDTLRRQLGDVEVKRSRLVRAGLLREESSGWGVPSLDRVDESKLGVLSVFAQDASKKLGVFDDLYARVDALKRIANSRFLYKQVSVGPQGLGVVSSDNSRLELEMLSSGEQHELVLLYDLLFRVPNNAFILIDEPELSLHVAWQEEFLNDLQEIAKLSEFRVLLATHSPQIIGDRWDLTIELTGPARE